MHKNMFYLIVFVLTSVCAEKPLIETSHGKVLGKVLKSLIQETEYYGFLGIPYAQPPVKELRFLPPQPIEPWDEVLSTTKEKQPCVQYNNNIKKGQPLGHYGVEDCLYLDIFTPSLNNRLPVIVFLYNERFTYSYNKTKDYAPDFFIENEVVIATISHRLSVFGFLSFEDDILSGNSGLKDIVAGLEWIRNNVERFGGDPYRITLMGAQGGAAGVDLLIHSQARGLFNSVILQGGTSFTSTYLQTDVRERALKLGEILEMDSSTSNRLLKELNEISPKDLLFHELRAIPPDYGKENQRALLAFGPIVEKDLNGLVTEYPEESKGIDVPVMIGFNSREGLEKSLQYLIEPNYLGSVNIDFVLLMPIRVNFKFDLDDSYAEAVDEIKKFYFRNGVVTARDITDYVTYIGDLNNVAIDFAARFYSQISSSEVYYYYFDYYGDLNDNKNDLMKLSNVGDGTWGAASGDELCYLFKCPSLTKKYLKHNSSMSEDIVVQKILVRMWTNFAKYGNPTPEGDTLLKDLKWPPYNTETKEYLHIGKRIGVKRDLCQKRFEFWNKFVRKWEERAVDGIVSKSKNKREEL